MKIICIGMNYVLHKKELGHTEETPEPVIFLKPDSAILRDGKPFFLPDFSQNLQYETEVVVRISRLGKAISPKFVRRYYDAVTVGIDFTARDFQNRFRAEGHPWELSKGFDESAVIGDFIPLTDVGNEVQNLHFHLDVDGKTVQQGFTGDMLFKVDEIICYVSKFMTLKIGDLIYTGTPVGVGRVAVGNHLQGYLEDKKLLDFYVR